MEENIKSIKYGFLYEGECKKKNSVKNEFSFKDIFSEVMVCLGV